MQDTTPPQPHPDHNENDAHNQAQAQAQAQGGGGGGGGGGVGRRQFVTGAVAAAGAVAAGALGTGTATAATAPAAGARKAPRTRKAAGRRVAIFGGGMGGLSTAHELAERGFEVTIYERKTWGGKNRSIPVPGTGTAGRKDLPGEHGFRFFPGFYQNLPDTMSRIPVPGGGNAAGNLQAGKEVSAYYDGTKIILPAAGSIEGTLSPESLLNFLSTGINVLGKVPLWEVGYFLQKMIAFVTSGPKRRYGQWENLS
ncbi:FAD-dependent oxidoreductase, partial [Spirillospora sp. NPDC048823]|uniref:FAD-dependent oxidoreductase n=1 Tax=unclassified Spirillospora TaxID=2642701 RepID=UPI0037121765